MRVLVTGAFGNIGTATLHELLAQGHTVRAFDRPAPATRRTAAQYGGAVEVLWGDIRRPDDVARAVDGQEAVVHLAFVLPPQSERSPDLARAANVNGSQHLIAALQGQKNPVRLLFASSYSVHGDTRGLTGLLTPESPLQALNHYNEHKIAVEEMVRASGLTWCILRFGSVLPPEPVGRLDPVIFDLPPDARQEYLHPRDAALAIANCLPCAAAWGRIWMIGGGPACQVYYGEMINRTLEALGLGRLPAEAFSPVARQGGGWMDTRESQRLLQYQRYTFSDYLAQLAFRKRWQRPMLRLLSPLARRYIVRQSPYIRSRQG